MISYGAGDGEKERCPLPQFSLSPYRSPMPLDNSLDDGKPHARAFILVCTVQPLKDSEKAVGITHVETRAVVAHEVDRLPIGSR